MKIILIILCAFSLQFTLLAKSETKSKAVVIPLEAQTSVFKKLVPILNKYCINCHNDNKHKGGLNLNALEQNIVKGKDAQVWHEVLDMLNLGEMPPENKKQPKTNERRLLIETLTNELSLARQARKGILKNVMRRMTKEQYQNTISDLLQIPITDYAEDLPNDGVSKEGFKNNADVLNMSTLHLQTYMQAARKALSKAMVKSKPDVLKLRVEFGEKINQVKIDEDYMLGKHGHLLSTKHYIISEPIPNRNYEFNHIKPIKMHKFNNHYRGNAGVNGVWKSFKGIYHTVYCEFTEKVGHKRNFPGLYDQTLITKYGLVLKPKPPRNFGGEMQPSREFKGQMSLSTRHYPKSGALTIKVVASVGPDSMIVAYKGSPIKNKHTQTINLKPSILYSASERRNRRFIKENKTRKESEKHKPYSYTSIGNVDINTASLYQIDISLSGNLRNNAQINFEIDKSKIVFKELKVNENSKMVDSSVLIHLRKGKHTFKVVNRNCQKPIKEINFTKVNDKNKLTILEKHQKDYFSFLQVSLGTKSKIHLPYRFLPQAKKITAPYGSTQTLIYNAIVENYPIPPENMNKDDYMSYLLNIGFMNAPIDSSNDIVIKSVEIESNKLEHWPPQHHKAIFVNNPNDSKETQVKDILKDFMPKAFRRPVSEAELTAHVNFWKEIYLHKTDFDESVKEILAVILSSPQFIYIDKKIKNTTKASVQYSLASKLAYFLWNSMPDKTLLEVAKNGTLLKDIDKHISRMLKDKKSYRLSQSFSRDWMEVEKLDQNVNFKGINEDVRVAFKKQSYKYFHYIIKENLSIMNFIKSDFSILNSELVKHYGVQGKPDSHNYELVKTKGGLLHHGGIMSSLVSGKHVSPIKRGVWLSYRLLGIHPPKPPPNVPELDTENPEFAKLSIRDQLKLHSNKESCRDCHAKIDPWGIPLQSIGITGKYLKATDKEFESKFPDGTLVNGIEQLKTYILKEKKDSLNLGFIKFLCSYAIGRSLSFEDSEEINRIVSQSKNNNYRAQTIIKAIIKSNLFMPVLKRS